MTPCLLACDDWAMPPSGAPVAPWTAYLAWVGGELVGGGGFTAPPRDCVVEIGYFTLPAQRRQGHGGATAAALLAIARAADPDLRVRAHTVRTASLATDDGPSARILRRLGFHCLGPVHEADTGPAWRWEIDPARRRRAGAARGRQADPGTRQSPP